MIGSRWKINIKKYWPFYDLKKRLMRDFGDEIGKIYDEYEQVLDKNIWLIKITYIDTYRILEFVNVNYKFEDIKFVAPVYSVWLFEVTVYYCGLYGGIMMKSLSAAVNDFNEREYNTIGYFETPFSIEPYVLKKTGDKQRKWTNSAKDIYLQGIMTDDDLRIKMWVVCDKFSMEQIYSI
jgi:hypothetical protein